MKKFKFFEHTADVEFEAYGGNLKEAFENAALVVSEVMTDTKKVEPRVREKISIESEDLKSLLYDFLEKLLILHDSKNLVFSKFEINYINKENDKFRLEGFFSGEEFNLEKHESRNAVKAVTYHQMNIEKKKGKYFIHVVLDI